MVALPGALCKNVLPSLCRLILLSKANKKWRSFCQGSTNGGSDLLETVFSPEYMKNTRDDSPRIYTISTAISTIFFRTTSIPLRTNTTTG